MSGLARDAAAFKSSLQRQDYTSWHSNPKPLAEAEPAVDKHKKKAKASKQFRLKLRH